MKIAVASDDGINLTGHVGRCEMFIVYEALKDKIISSEKRVNDFTLHKSGVHIHGNHDENHSITSHGRIVNGLKDCSYLVCSSCGPGLVNDLMSSGIQVILTEDIEAEKAVRLLLEGKLESDPGRQCKGHKH